MSTPPQTMTAPPASRGDRGPDRSEQVPTVSAEQLLELLGDEYTRRILRAVTDKPRTGREIAETADVSKPTAYRRLERLEEAGLVVPTQRLDPDGHHCKQFHAVVAGMDFDIGPDGVSVSFQTDDTPGNSSRRALADD